MNYLSELYKQEICDLKKQIDNKDKIINELHEEINQLWDDLQRIDRDYDILRESEYGY